MSALFSSKKNSAKNKTTKTFLVVDVENGSVASALAHISPDELPKLFADKRVSLPILQSVSSERLVHELSGVLEEVLSHTTEIAAQVRANPTTAHVGELSGAAVFLGAPWAALAHGDGRLQWEFEPELLSTLKHTIESRVAPHLIQFHPFGKTVANATGAFTSGALLTCIVTGEVTELILSDSGRVIGRATVPVGVHTIVRTLQSHAGVSLAEAHSLLRLLRASDEHPFNEALDAAAKHYAAEFSNGAGELLQQVRTDTVLVVAPPTVASWLARALSRRVIAADIFPHGGAVRALQPRHLEKYVVTHPTTDDLSLILEAMFIHNLHTPALAGV